MALPVNQIICGDCLEVMPTLPDGCIDMVMCDPPYGTTACKWDSIIPLEPMWEQLKQLIKPNGAIVMTASQPFTTTLIASNMKMFRYCWIWEKTRVSGFLDCRRRPLLNYEDICVFSHKQTIYNPQGVIHGKFKNSRPCKNNPKYMEGKVYGNIKQTKFATQRNYPRRIIKISNPNNKTLHPTQKPVALMEYLIKTYTNEGELVLDFTIGSGTTAVACINTGRNFIGIERDEKYCEIANKRIAEAKGQMGLFEEKPCQPTQS
ncbi:MAG: site-specific DNA-methyltransferase [Candidatus Peribacteraceae bacterium]|nr:site-specific DNA-methyltransferase [Candidatus Peribacteraceae bacterium]